MKMKKDIKIKADTTKEKPKKQVTKLKNKINPFKKKTEKTIFQIVETMKASDLVSATNLKEHIDLNNMPKWSYNYIKFVYETEIKKTTTILIRMVLKNGKITSFYINADKPIFNYMKGSYIIDSSKISQDVNTGHATLFYHQDISLPFNLIVDSEKIKKGVLNNEDFEEIAQNINPDVLKSTVTSTLIKQVMAGGLLDKQLRSVIIIMVVNLVLTIILMIGMLINGFVV